MHQPPTYLNLTTVSWPFEAWGMDIIGKFLPPPNKGHHFILEATNYFSKWSKAVPLAKVKATTIVNFVKNHIICHFGVPKRLYHDNGPQFSYNKFYRFYDKYGIHCCPSTAYNPAANGLAKAFNKTICSIRKKIVSNNKKSWGTKLHEVFWAYQTTVRGPNSCLHSGWQLQKRSQIKMLN